MNQGEEYPLSDVNLPGSCRRSINVAHLQRDQVSSWRIPDKHQRIAQPARMRDRRHFTDRPNVCQRQRGCDWADLRS